jgi:hypothetical protein
VTDLIVDVSRRKAALAAGIGLLLMAILAPIANFAFIHGPIVPGDAALGYLIDSLGKILLPDYNLTIAAFTFIGEVLLLFWLFIKGSRLPEGD